MESLYGLFFSGADMPGPLDQIKALLARFGVGEQTLPAVQARPPQFGLTGEMGERFMQSPYVRDTLSQLFAGPHSIGPETGRGNVLGHVALNKPRDVFVRPGGQEEGTLGHELVHSDELTSGFRIPEELRKDIAVAFWEANPDLRKRASERYKYGGERSADFLGRTVFSRWAENAEASAEAFESAMDLIRSREGEKPEILLAADRLTPGTELMYYFLKENIRESSRD